MFCIRNHQAHCEVGLTVYKESMSKVLQTFFHSHIPMKQKYLKFAFTTKH